MDKLKENIMFLYTRYEPSFYIKTYLMLFTVLFITRSITGELFNGSIMVL